MIAGISGRVQSSNNGELTIMTAGGVAYGLLASPTCLAECPVGRDVTIDTYLVVKEDALDLYGFASGDEKQLFKLLISISGVGPKTALNILALGAVGDIAGAIGQGDVAYLTKVSGIGKKTAERLVLELRSKLQHHSFAVSDASSTLGTSVVRDVAEGLEALGYSSLEVREVVQSLEVAGKTSEQLLREALSQLGK